MEIPFHFPGPITPNARAAWAAMHWHDDASEEIISGLKRDPPDYFQIRGPIQSGKTTLLTQVRYRLATGQPEIILVYAGLASLGPTATESSVMTYVADQIDGQSKRLGWANAASALGELRERDSSTTDELVAVLRDWFCRIPNTDTLVLLLDDLDALPQKVRNTLLISLRTIHGQRLDWPNRNHAVGIASTVDLATRCLGASSPFNVSVEYDMRDISLDGVREFLRRCSISLDGVMFAPDAINYLFRQTQGHMALIQNICHHAFAAVSRQDTITLDDILGAIQRIYEAPEPCVSAMLDAAEIDGVAGRMLRELIMGFPVLPFNNAGQLDPLISSGIVKKSSANRLVFRCPLLHAILAHDLAQRTAISLPPLNLEESVLIQLPQVLVVLLNRPLRAEVLNSLDGFGGLKDAGTVEDRMFEELQNRSPKCDLVGAEYMSQKYLPHRAEQQLHMEEVLQLIAKVWSFWSARSAPDPS